LRAILDLGTGLNLKTIAEGVEQENQAIYLKDLGCDSAQGYFYARPMSPERLSIRLEEDAWDSALALPTA
jgi:EAL domain-containing protein (putative c-di-GMP-specific phosphodiesterase class I)